MTKSTEADLAPYLKAVSGKKAENVIALDVKGLTSIADMFVICSGRSSRQTAAVADHIEAELKKIGKKPLSVEGRTHGHWILMDYGDVVIHIFYEETRQFYNIEGLWADARRIDTSESEALIEAEGMEIEDESSSWPS